jgi:protein-S-isoprenylcysteine O-methyltransferase Ste14
LKSKVIMNDSYQNIPILISPLIIGLGILILFLTKRDYEGYQHRSKSTSIICLVYHEIYVGITSFSAWLSIWPFFRENKYLRFHVFFYSLGVSITLTSIFIYVLYLLKMESVQRAVGRHPDKLVTEGIFTKSRNPQSFARALGLIGLGIWGRSFHALFLALLWILINHPYILIEENFLKLIFGERYLEYCSETPRYCGILSPFKNLVKK